MTGMRVPCYVGLQLVTDQLVSNTYQLVPTYLPARTNLPTNSYHYESMFNIYRPNL